MPTYINQSNEEVKIFGLVRLNLIEIITQILKLDSREIIEAYLNCNTILFLLGILALHPWNNTLKIRTHEAILFVLESKDE